MNEILIYGDIGFEVQAKDIVNQLNDADGPLSVRVDSFGGDVYAGISILNALRRYPDVVTVYVDGIAASAASFIAVGGADKLIMSPNSSLLIHGAWSQGMGNSEEIAQLAKDLNQVTDNLATIYAEKTGKEPAYWRELMKKDTTFTAEQAVEAGLADAVAEFEKSAKAEKCHAVMASQRSRFAMAGGRGVPEIESRAAAPPPPTSKPSDGQKEDTLSIENLAQELGVEPDELRKKLSGFFNEAVTISGEVDVTYPADVRIVPTERITVDPTIGDKPAEGEQVEVVPDGTEPQPDSAAVQLAKSAGLTFVMGDIADGFEASVDEGGTVTIKAPSGVEPGDTAEFSVMVNETAVPLTVTVRGLSDEEDVPGEEAPVETAPAPDMVTLDRETYADLRAAAQLGWKAMEAEKVAKLDAEVDGWITEGRISSAMRAKAVKAIRTNADLARDLYGSNPAGTIPRNEIGSGHDPATDSTVPSADDLRALSESRRKSGNK